MSETAALKEHHIENKYEAEKPEHENTLLVFELAGEHCGLEANNVRSIVTLPPRITRVPNSPDYIPGVINLRGSIIPVLDCSVKMNGMPTHRGNESRIVVVEYDGIMFGIFVEAVREVRVIYDSQIEMPDASKTGSVAMEYVTGIAKMDDGRLIVILDLHSLFGIDELTSEDEN